MLVKETETDTEMEGSTGKLAIPIRINNLMILEPNPGPLL